MDRTDDRRRLVQRKPEKAAQASHINAHVPAEAKRWVAAIDYAEPRTWLRRGTSTQTILCPIKAAGEAHCLFAKIEGKGKTDVTVVIGVSDLKGVKLEKCQKAATGRLRSSKQYSTSSSTE